MYYAKFDAQGERVTSIATGVHFTTEEELKKYLDDGFVEIGSEDQALYQTNDYICDLKTGKPIARPPYEQTVQEAARQTWTAVKAARNAAEQVGCPYMGKVLDSDNLSVQRINTAVQAAQFTQAQNKEFTIDWTMQDNSVIKMSIADVLGMPVALAAYSDQLHGKARQLREQIERIVADHEAKALTAAKAKTVLGKIKFDALVPKI